jgi:hypothetical protein
MIDMNKHVITLLCLSLLTACGGGGGGGGSSTPSTPNPPVVQGTSFVGIYSGLVDYEPIQIADFKLSGSSIEDIYAGNDLLLKKDTLKKAAEFQGEVYLFNKDLATVFFSSNKKYAAMLIEADYVGTYQADSLPSKSITRESINGSWAGYYFYEYRGAIYQVAITTECASGVCVHTDDTTKEQITLDFAKEFHSSFKAEGAWFGKEANGGERVFSSAAISPDGNFLSMPMCWQTFAFDDEIFFNICDLAVLIRKQ